MEILCGTNNKGKLIEIGEVFDDTDIHLLSLNDKNITGDPDETGTTYAENAELKARFFYEASGMPTIADDSGIVVDALQNELGIHTRRWGAGATATDEEWIEYFLQRMEGEEQKNASFICTVCFIDEQGSTHFFEGKCEGTITQTLEADYLPGLPISACFKPTGYEHVFSALTVDEKNAVSHRGRAALQLRDYLLNR